MAHLFPKSASMLVILGGLGVAAVEPDGRGIPSPLGVSQASTESNQPFQPFGRIELLRQNTERGDPEENTRTTLRFEAFLDGVISRLRLDLPFPDAKDDGSDDPFNPKLGDLKVKAYFRPFQVGNTRVSPDVELTFPTANESVSGSGKYQLGGAVAAAHSLPAFDVGSSHHQPKFEWTLRQTLSIAGDAARKDINTTKPEFGVHDAIGSRYWLKLTLKAVIDWVQNGKSGGNLELEAGWHGSQQWRFSLKGGTRVWGEGVPGVYGSKIELIAGRDF